MPAGSSPPLRRRRLSIELRRLRQTADMRHEDVASAMQCSEAKISRIEGGRSRVSLGDLRLLLDLYGVKDPTRRQWLEELNRRSREKGWWHRFAKTVPHWFEIYLELEEVASPIRYYQHTTVPGLLQTEAYATAVLKAGFAPTAETSQQVEFRLARQRILTSDHPPKLWVILDENVLRRAIGGPAVMKEQLNRLVNAAVEPNITIQVLPFSIGAHKALTGSFVLLDFPEEETTDPPVVYLQNAIGALYPEELDEVRRYEEIFNHLVASSLNEDESVDLIAAVAREYEA